MVRRSLGVALWMIVGLLACFLGALSALVGTGAGRGLLARVMESALAQVFTGSIEVADVRGSLLTGVTLTGVRLFDADTTLVAWLPRADLTYNPFDFAAGRVVFFEFALRQPVITLVQHRSGRLNIEELLRLGGPDSGHGPHGPATLILFRNVQIEDGTVTLRLQAQRAEPGDTALEIQGGGPNGRVRVRRFEHLDARLAALQVSSPVERGIGIDISRLAVESSDPALRLVDVAGRLHVIGDSLEFDLSRVKFPGSALRAARGRVSWPRGPLLFDLSLHADSATLGDFHFIDRRFAPGAVLAGGVRLKSHGQRVLEVGLDPLRVSEGGGTVTGRLTALSASDSGLVALRDADLAAQDFDLEFARPFLDTLPFAGRLSGHTTATGPVSGLTLDIDWVFRDSLVPGHPATRIRGRGEVGLGGSGLRFQPFTVEAAAVDWGTVERLVPAAALHGVLYAAGTLSGPLKNAQFTGTLEHRDGALAPSRLTGTVRLDGRGDTLGVYADVAADSLSFDGLKGSFPTLPFSGAVAGTVKLAGPLPQLETHTVLHSAGGTVQGDGVLRLGGDGASGRGVRDFTMRTRDLDLASWLKRAPASLLTVTVQGDVAVDSGAPPVGALRVRVEPSLFAGTPLDSGVAAVRLADRHLYVDSLRLVQPGLITTGGGTLGWTRGDRGTLALDFDADSLNSLDSLLSWVTGSDMTARGDPGDPDNRGVRPLAGAARVLVSLEGSLDSLGVDVRASLERLQWRGWSVPREGRVRLVYRPGPVPAFELDATLDSVAHGVLGFAATAAALHGTRDSLVWFSRSRVGEGGAFLAGGRFARSRDITAVGIDSLALQLPGDVWVLERPTELTVTDSTARVSGFSLQSVYGAGKLTFAGDLPTHGRADAHLQLESFPLVGVYALLERDTAGVGGVITAAAGLAGTRADPVSTGTFSVTNGSFGEFHAPFADGTFDYRARRLDAALNLWRSRQQILTVRAQLVLDLHIAADQFRALDLKNNVSITASGQLALAGPVFGASLTGRASVTSGVLYFADLVQKRIVNLDELADTSLAAIIQQQRLGPEFQNVFLDSLRIDDLELEMGSDVWLRSNEANIQLTGSAHLTKQRNLYLVSGTLQAARGTYRLKQGPVTRELVVSQGTVKYIGTPDQDAALDIEARHVVHPVPTLAQKNPDDITVVAHIGGTLLVPKVTLAADKRDLSQTEIISYLLFGKGSVELGEQGGITDQRALLQSALSVLSGEIEQTIVSGGVPVDYVEIRPGGGGQGAPLSSWQFAVRRQLGAKTFLVLNAGFCEGRQVSVRNTPGLSLQFRISPEWRTEASFEPVQTCADPSTESQGGTVPRQVGLDLFWEKRY